jgi:ferredoxin
VDAFHVGETQVVIDPEECIDCGVCISECPEEAITTEDDAEEKWVKFNAEKSQEWPNAAE